jgi:hypothetical protein
MCEQYYEDRKDRHTKRTRNAKRERLVDIILEYVQNKNIASVQEWENTVGPDTQLQLLKEFGPSVDSYVQKIVRIVKSEKMLDIKNKTLTDLLMPLLEQEQHADDTNQHVEIISWIRYLFRINNIDIIDFLAWNEIVKSQRYMKINSIVLQGYTNAGKSLIIDNLISVCNPEQIPRDRDNSRFHLDQLPSSACVLFEEPTITPVNFGTWKLLLEGKTVKTDIRHKDKEAIKRLPIWINTASPITNNIDANESIQIHQRIKLWVFKKCIHHREDEDTVDTEISSRLIENAPGFIRPVHFAILWFWHFEEILSRIHDLDEHHVRNIKCIDISRSTIEKAIAWQTLVRAKYTIQTTDIVDNVE